MEDNFFFFFGFSRDRPHWVRHKTSLFWNLSLASLFWVSKSRFHALLGFQCVTCGCIINLNIWCQLHVWILSSPKISCFLITGTSNNASKQGLQGGDSSLQAHKFKSISYLKKGNPQTKAKGTWCQVTFVGRQMHSFHFSDLK